MRLAWVIMQYRVVNGLESGGRGARQHYLSTLQYNLKIPEASEPVISSSTPQPLWFKRAQLPRSRSPLACAYLASLTCALPNMPVPNMGSVFLASLADVLPNVPVVSKPKPIPGDAAGLAQAPIPGDAAGLAQASQTQALPDVPHAGLIRQYRGAQRASLRRPRSRRPRALPVMKKPGTVTKKPMTIVCPQGETQRTLSRRLPVTIVSTEGTRFQTDQEGLEMMKSVDAMVVHLMREFHMPKNKAVNIILFLGRLGQKATKEHGAFDFPDAFRVRVLDRGTGAVAPWKSVKVDMKPAFVRKVQGAGLKSAAGTPFAGL